MEISEVKFLCQTFVYILVFGLAPIVISGDAEDHPLIGNRMMMIIIFLMIF